MIGKGGMEIRVGGGGLADYFALQCPTVKVSQKQGEKKSVDRKGSSAQGWCLYNFSKADSLDD